MKSRRYIVSDATVERVYPVALWLLKIEIIAIGSALMAIVLGALIMLAISPS